MATFKTINLSPSDVSVISNSVGYILESETSAERVPLNNLLTKYAGKETRDFLFPIGFVIESTNANFNPNNVYGGQWEEYGQGRALIGSAGPDSANVNTTIGTYSHVLTVDEMPSHSHALGYAGSVNYAGSKSVDIGEMVNQNASYWTGYVGGSQAHNNIQPYTLCYRWRRVG